MVKHAQARRVTLSLLYEADGGVRARLMDDGRGFDPASIPAGHLGVGIMRERADALGARFQLTSRPGAGSTIDVYWQEREGSAP